MFVQAKCPECGGMLAVDADKKAAICQFCGEAFIVQEAINNYNTYNETVNNYNTTHQYGEGSVVNVYEDKNKDFVIEAGVLKEYHGASVDVVIPEGVRVISDDCFKDMNLDSLSFPSTLTSIGKILGNMTSTETQLKAVYVDENNAKYFADDNVLFEKHDDGTIEILYFAGGRNNYTIPQNVNKMGYPAYDQVQSFDALYWKGYDLFHLPCGEAGIIKEVKDNHFPYSLVHDYVDQKCTTCCQYDIFSCVDQRTIDMYDKGSAIINIAHVHFFSDEKAVLTYDANFYRNDIRPYNCQEDFPKIEVLVLFNDQSFETTNEYIFHHVEYCLRFFPDVTELIIEEDPECYSEKTDGYKSLLDAIIGQSNYLPKLEKITLGGRVPKETSDLIREYELILPRRKQIFEWIEQECCPYCGGKLKLPSLLGVVILSDYSKQCKKCKKWSNVNHRSVSMNWRDYV